MTQTKSQDPAPEHYHSFVAPLRDAVDWLEHTKAGAQLFRFLRITLLGVGAFYVAHNDVTGVAVVGAAEVAFRQVFPPSH